MRDAFGATFLGPDGYLNSPTTGLPPTTTLEVLEQTHHDWGAGLIQGPDFDADVATARAGFAALAGVPVESVAMGGSVASLLAPVAAAIPDGSTVLVAEGEFTSVSFPFAAQGARGVTVTELPLDRIPDVATEYAVVAVSTVQSSDGSRVDLEALREQTSGTGTIIILDATQQLGWLQLDLGWADVVAGSSFKWLLGPRGVAWAAYSERLADRLVPHGANWYAGEKPWESIYGLPLRLARDARRFDSSPAWFAVRGAAASLTWLTTLDQQAVTDHCIGLAGLVREALDLPPGRSAIVSIPTDDAAARLHAAGVRASVRQGAARVGFHLYNTRDDVDRVVEALGR